MELKAGPDNGVRFIQQGDRVVVVWGGKLAADLDWKGALALARALSTVAKQAEEWAHAEQIAFDQALLIRSGAPIGLTSHPRIQDEAAKEAAHNRTLRKGLPGGIKSQEQMGRPAILNPGPGAKANGR